MFSQIPKKIAGQLAQYSPVAGLTMIVGHGTDPKPAAHNEHGTTEHAPTGTGVSHLSAPTDHGACAEPLSHVAPAVSAAHTVAPVVHEVIKTVPVPVPVHQPAPAPPPKVVVQPEHHDHYTQVTNIDNHPTNVSTTVNQQINAGGNVTTSVDTNTVSGKGALGVLGGDTADGHSTGPTATSPALPGDHTTPGAMSPGPGSGDASPGEPGTGGTSEPGTGGTGGPGSGSNDDLDDDFGSGAKPHTGDHPASDDGTAHTPPPSGGDGPDSPDSDHPGVPDGPAAPVPGHDLSPPAHEPDAAVQPEPHLHSGPPYDDEDPDGPNDEPKDHLAQSLTDQHHGELGLGHDPLNAPVDQLGHEPGLDPGHADLLGHTMDIQDHHLDAGVEDHSAALDVDHEHHLAV